jgi:hypothetical protein
LFLLFMSVGWDCPWSAAIRRPVVYPADDIQVWRATAEWYWWENQSPSQCHFVHQKSHVGLHSDRPVTNHLSHGMASLYLNVDSLWFLSFH